MKKLYCADCGNYLMAGDGECHDCPCGWKQPEHNMSLDWLENAKRAMEDKVWVVRVYEHDNATKQTTLVSETGAPSEEIAHSWAMTTLAFWKGEDEEKDQPNASFFTPDVYLVPHKTYTYTIEEGE